MDLHALTRHGLPWAYSLPTAVPDEHLLALEASGVAVRFLRGAKCRTGAGLFDECAAALQFPATFGHNWDALADCLEDEDIVGRKGVVIRLAHAGAYRKAHAADWETFSDILDEAADYWRERHLPFWVFVA